MKTAYGHAGLRHGIVLRAHADCSDCSIAEEAQGSHGRVPGFAATSSRRVQVRYTAFARCEACKRPKGLSKVQEDSNALHHDGYCIGFLCLRVLFCAAALWKRLCRPLHSVGADHYGMSIQYSSGTGCASMQMSCANRHMHILQPTFRSIEHIEKTLLACS